MTRWLGAKKAHPRDPNAYVIELTAKMPGHDAAMSPALNRAHKILDRWQDTKENPPTA